LNFWIALLDHTPKGNIYDNLIVGFLTVKGIEAKTSAFRDPSDYTTTLSIQPALEPSEIPA
jgi:hypothetical protein